MRTLRSKKLRAALYYSQDGKCAICGVPLPDDWHADHIVPWVCTHRTNIHEMQALCPKCNLEKGTKMLRKHQSGFRDIVRRMASGASKVRNIGVHATPGSGKSALPMILDKELAEPLGYRICWIVPRDALRNQAEGDFVDLDKRKLFGHQSMIRAAGNDTNPSRGTRGYVTCYQAVAQDPKLHLDEFALHPYILVLDECHHVPYKGESEDEEARYYSAVAPLVERCKILVLMSGTLERHDKRRVAFWPYERFGPGESPVTKPKEDLPEWAFVRYTRKDALGESAIVPLHFYAMDARAKWYDPKTGTERDVESMAESSKQDESAVLHVTLATEYAYQLIDKCITDWQSYKQRVYPHAKLLVVAPNINTAKDYIRHLQRNGFRALIATSDDSEQARANIEQFKKGQAEILVTVGMAYEGLDVPEISHIALLTNIRSRSWIEQCICRANRTAKGKTHGYVYHPDDPRINTIMAAVKAEQAAVVIDWPPRTSGGNGGGSEFVPIAPIDSGWTRSRGGELEEGTDVSYAETMAIETAIEQAGISCSVVQMKQALVALGMAVVPNGPAPQPDYQTPVTVPSKMEANLKQTITITISRIAKRICNDDKERKNAMIRDINTALRGYFPPRDECTVEQLQGILRHLSKHYGEVI